jgi:hypothetical protein
MNQEEQINPDKKILKYIIRKTRALSSWVIEIYRKLPFRRFVVFSMLSIGLSVLIFHVYIASPNRIINELTAAKTELIEVITASKVIDETIEKLNNDNLQAAINILKSQNEIINSLSSDLPWSLATMYALNGKGPEMSSLTAKLYSNNTKIDKRGLIEITTTTVSLLEIAHDTLSEQPVSEDQAAYSQRIKIAIEKLQELDKSESIDLKTVIRLYQYIYEASIGYESNKDIFGYTNRYSNLSSEIVKEVQNSWKASESKALFSKITDRISTIVAIITNYRALGS